MSHRRTTAPVFRDSTQDAEKAMDKEPTEEEDPMEAFIKKTKAEEDEKARILAERCPVERDTFVMVIMAGICINAVQMGLELQFRGDDMKLVWRICENFWTGFFLVEMIMKWYYLGLPAYFKNKANIMDFVIVSVAILDTWCLSIILSASEMKQLGFLQVLKLVRLARILKLLRLKRELAMLIDGIASSISSMAWLGVLLAILIYTSAICFIQFIGESDLYTAEIASGEFDNKAFFGDMVSACMTGLNLALLVDWTAVIRPVLKHQPHFALFIGVYVGAASFGIMNALIGVIVSRTSKAAEASALASHEEHQKEQMKFVSNIGKIIYEIDTDGGGTISQEEIEQAEGHEDLNNMLNLVDLPWGFTLGDLHTMLDKDGDGELSKSEFFVSMKRLIFSGEFQRECVLLLAVSQSKRKMYAMKHEMEERFDKLSLNMENAFGKLFRHVDNVAIGSCRDVKKAETPDDRAVSPDELITLGFCGKIGAMFLGESGIISSVNDGQAQSQGVQVGWQIVSVNNLSYTKAMFQDRIAAATPYKLTFNTRVNADVTEVTSEYVWTQSGIDILKSTGHFDVYGQPTLGSAIPENCGDDLIGAYMESGYVEKLEKACELEPVIEGKGSISFRRRLSTEDDDLEETELRRLSCDSLPVGMSLLPEMTQESPDGKGPHNVREGMERILVQMDSKMRRMDEKLNALLGIPQHAMAQDIVPMPHGEAPELKMFRPHGAISNNSAMLDNMRNVASGAHQAIFVEHATIESRIGERESSSVIESRIAADIAILREELQALTKSISINHQESPISRHLGGPYTIAMTEAAITIQSRVPPVVMNGPIPVLLPPAHGTMGACNANMSLQVGFDTPMLLPGSPEDANDAPSPHLSRNVPGNMSASPSNNPGSNSAGRSALRQSAAS